MNYYLDTEFHEYFRKPFLGKKRHVIDLISIGIVAEDKREYYAICKEFDVAAAWNSWQNGEAYFINSGMEKRYKREYWLRENVLKPIWRELLLKFYKDDKRGALRNPIGAVLNPTRFTLSGLKALLKLYGKTREQIAKEIMAFEANGIVAGTPTAEQKPVFYGYYADYDWVVFCSLFGKMMDLPKGFPMYMRDLKQTQDEVFDRKREGRDVSDEHIKSEFNLNPFKNSYPKQANEHNALADARWNKALHDFLNAS